MFDCQISMCDMFVIYFSTVCLNCVLLDIILFTYIGYYVMFLLHFIFLCPILIRVFCFKPGVCVTDLL